MTIVVAKYKENTSWINFLNYKHNVIVINKTNELDPYTNIVLENIGRESHSYLWYIINYYDYLDEYTCFMQGNPFDHSPNIINHINNFDYKTNFLPLGIRICDTIKDNCKHHPGLKTSNFSKLINIPNEWDFCAGAQFIVSRNCILQHSKEYYRELFDMHYTNEQTPWCLERLWQFIFS
jgi:hypothetical protein